MERAWSWVQIVTVDPDGQVHSAKSRVRWLGSSARQRMSPEAIVVDPDDIERAWGEEMLRRSQQIAAGEVRTMIWDEGDPERGRPVLADRYAWGCVASECVVDDGRTRRGQPMGSREPVHDVVRGLAPTRRYDGIHELDRRRLPGRVVDRGRAGPESLRVAASRSCSNSLRRLVVGLPRDLRGRRLDRRTAHLNS